MYIEPEFSTKGAFMDAVRDDVKMTIYTLSPFPPPKEGEIVISDIKHRWSARVYVKDGKIRRVIR
jgi:hypothetical protein